MVSKWVVVVLGVGAALAFALSTTLKNRMSAEVTDLQRQPTRLASFVAETVRHPLWLLAAVADIVGLGLQVTALHFGTLTLVQPLLVTGLLFALLLRHGAFWRIGRPELLWALLLTGCLIGFLIASGAMSTTSTVSGADRLPGAMAALAALLAGSGCLVLAQRSVPPAGRAALIGAAVGGVYAGTAALIKAATDVLSRRGVLALMSSWQLYAVLCLGGLGLLLAQMAFQAGPLTASLPAISTVDPLFSVVIGVVVYDERLRRGPLDGVVLLITLLLLAVSVIQLVRQGSAEHTAQRPDSPEAVAERQRSR